MPIGSITAVRFLQNLKNVLNYARGRDERNWWEEQFNTIQATELTTIEMAFDTQAAIDQTSQIRLEHTDAYCLARDTRYANRSRRWLYTRAVATKIDHDYEGWLTYVRENLPGNLDYILKTDPDLLAEMESVQSLMGLTDAIPALQEPLIQ